MTTPETKLTVETCNGAFSPAPSITFHNANREVFRITNDARMIIGEGFTKDEATQEVAKMLVAAFDEKIQEMVDKRVSELKYKHVSDLESELQKIVLIAGLKADSNVELRMRAEKAEADSKRLDWLESNKGIRWQQWNDILVELDRSAIDAAMKEASK